MVSTPEPLNPDQALQRLAAYLQRPGRSIIGLMGPPGAGKSTLSARIVAHFGTQAQVVPMDGYHLANSELERLDRRGRKGAPDTFDAWGYVALLQRLRQQAADEVVYAPEFRRTLKEPIAGAIPIAPDVPLLIAEGNYLGLDTGAWAGVAPLLDELWYVEVDDTLRRQRLTARHIQFGRTPEDAARWVEVTDEPNARLIAGTRARAQCVVRLDEGWKMPEPSTVTGIMTQQKILIVEDNVHVRHLYEHSLGSDYQVTLAASREEALRKLDKEIPDMAFVDVGLNEERGGLMLLEAMRADARFGHIPVAIVSARSEPDDVQLAKARGANAYLKKPFSVVQLKDLARTLLSGGAHPTPPPTVG